MGHLPRVALIAVSSFALAGCSYSAHEASLQHSPPAVKPRESMVVVRAVTRQAQRSPSLTATASPPVATRSATQVGTASPLRANEPATPRRPRSSQIAWLPPSAAPEILYVAVSETHVQPGDHVHGRVLTSSNVASVEARIGGYAVSLGKVGVGRFELTYTVGPLPWFVHGNFTMQVIARNTRGAEAIRAIPVTVR